MNNDDGTKTQENEHFDVLIIGAGISGIGAAYHLLQQKERRSFVILESMNNFGGTWKIHTYPGVRSDSDLYTFGYRFKPWTGPPIATGDQILTYLEEVIIENDISEHIRYGHKVKSASWSEENACWTLQATLTSSEKTVDISANFLWMCQGYYRHESGHSPKWRGMEDFQGQIVHPQTWPENLDYTDKQVVVIGSGATAATLIPAIATECAHVTMLQRSPTFYVVRPNRNELADTLRELDTPEEWVHEIVRRKTLHDQEQIDKLSKAFPELVREELYKGVRDILGDDYQLSPHFTPAYRPWQQRLAVIPDGDFLHSIAAGDASIVTDEISSFSETGIETKSGQHIAADIVVTATGFELSVLGDIDFTINGQVLNFADTVSYRGMMFTGVPNMVWVFGYFRASWTLRADLIADFVCRLLSHMDSENVSIVVPELRDEDTEMDLLPWVLEDDFNPGYLRRGIASLPRQGSKDPWIHTQNYWSDKKVLPAIDLQDGSLIYR